MFSGLISRAEAEELLGEDVEVGSFLVRLSDKVFGYTISFKDEERIKHFLIDASKPKKVKFDGSAEKTHKDLAALVEYHQVGVWEIKEETDDHFCKDGAYQSRRGDTETSSGAERRRQSRLLGPHVRLNALSRFTVLSDCYSIFMYKN